MAYDRQNFSGCQFNPLVKDKMLKAYPRLNEIINAEWMDTSLDAILRYIVMVYDPGSVLIKSEKDLNVRKGLAAELAGLPVDDAIFMESIYKFSHEYAASLTIRYLQRFAKNMEFAAIVIVENCFWESAKKLLDPILGKDSKAELEAVQKKSAIKDELDKDIARLQKYYKSFFGEDEDLESANKKSVTAESIARLKK